MRLPKPFKKGKLDGYQLGLFEGLGLYTYVYDKNSTKFDSYLIEHPERIDLIAERTGVDTDTLWKLRSSEWVAPASWWKRFFKKLKAND